MNLSNDWAHLEFKLYVVIIQVTSNIEITLFFEMSFIFERGCRELVHNMLMFCVGAMLNDI